MCAARAPESFNGGNDDQNVGVSILRRAIQEPLRQLVKNAGEEPSVILNKVSEGTGSYGYNAANGLYGDMLEFVTRRRDADSAHRDIIQSTARRSRQRHG